MCVENCLDAKRCDITKEKKENMQKIWILQFDSLRNKMTVLEQKNNVLNFNETSNKITSIKQNNWTQTRVNSFFAVWMWMCVCVCVIQWVFIPFDFKYFCFLQYYCAVNNFRGALSKRAGKKHERIIAKNFRQKYWRNANTRLDSHEQLTMVFTVQVFAVFFQLLEPCSLHFGNSFKQTLRKTMWNFSFNFFLWLLILFLFYLE